MTNPLLQHQLYAAKKCDPAREWAVKASRIRHVYSFRCFDVFDKDHKYQQLWLIKAVMCHKNLKDDLWIDIGENEQTIRYQLGCVTTAKNLLSETDLITFCLKALPILNGESIDEKQT